MKRKTKVLYTLSAVLLAAFGALIVLLRTYDVQAVGPQNSKIGFAALNMRVWNALGQSDLWYEITEALGLVAIAAVGAIVLLALAQWIRRKNLFRLDIDLWLTAAFLGVMAVLYVLFEVVVINYRPVLEEGALAASFPSSHTLLVFCVMWAAALQCARRIRPKSIRVAAVCVCILIIAVTAVGRLCSGVHWLTDIVGSVLLSGGLGLLYSALVSSTVTKGKHDQK
ncbi:MAG: phosphatase PAP2 family protein [Clostridia bacterium]|nr:phosphatase PAP2 family protein [Clostridia bacterium]